MTDKKKWLGIIVLVLVVIVAIGVLYTIRHNADQKARNEVINKTTSPVKLPPENPNSRPITDSPLPPPPSKP